MATTSWHGRDPATRRACRTSRKGRSPSGFDRLAFPFKDPFHPCIHNHEGKNADKDQHFEKVTAAEFFNAVVDERNRNQEEHIYRKSNKDKCVKVINGAV